MAIWDLDTNSIRQGIYNLHLLAIKSIKCLGKNVGFFATASVDTFISIWDIVTLEFVRRLEGHKNSVNCLEVLSNGQLASGSDDGTVRIWNLQSALVVNSYSPYINDPVRSIKETALGDLAIIGEYELVFFWNYMTNYEEQLEVAPSGSYPYASVLYDNDRILAMVYDDQVVIVDASNRQKINSFSSPYGVSDFMISIEHSSSCNQETKN